MVDFGQVELGQRWVWVVGAGLKGLRAGHGGF